jgi:hypothetical protein
LYKLFIDNNFSPNDYHFYFRPDIIKMVKKWVIQFIVI